MLVDGLFGNLMEVNNLKHNNCGKEIFDSKKLAKKSAKYLTSSKAGQYSAKYSYYFCKQCNAWHIYTENKNKIRSNKQHARGRGYNRKKVAYSGGRRR